MRTRIALGALAAVVGVIAGPVGTASAAPIDDCRGLRLVCIFESFNHGGQVVWTAVEDGTYTAPYRTRTTGSNVVNSTSSWVRLKQHRGNRTCQIRPGGDRDLPGWIDNNIGQIVVGEWRSGVANC
jgi:hypothetical protein